MPRSKVEEEEEVRRVEDHLSTALVCDDQHHWVWIRFKVYSTEIFDRYAHYYPVVDNVTKEC